ncbi:MAG: 5'-nucleotidase C-terminal domain-containing protein [Deltaproteobacteria bacterium]|nr:5'-nucleotidase C-terminal domain-containing protein [Deltaproteobacteria bacterium]MBW2533654.1 5'-nucleotidase C-terminal domain-containing protein [Deltaproteobacteria bacterium]
MLSYSEQNGLVCDYVDLQILMVADWHGQLETKSLYNGDQLGGAAVLSAYFQAERQQNPNTVVVFAGDSYGASPPLASFFEEQPVVEAMNLMGVDADALGNHSFDRGIEHVQTMAERAGYPFLGANVEGAEQSISCPSKADSACVEPYYAAWVGGVRVGVVGLLTPDTPNLVKPGAMGTAKVTDPIAAAADAKQELEARGAQVLVASAHMGVDRSEGEPTGALVDLAQGVPGFDAVLGGHTHLDLAQEVGDTMVVETASGGMAYARIQLRYEFASHQVVERSAEIVVADATAVTPDAAVEDLLAPYRTNLAARFDTPIGVATGTFERGDNVERLGEVPIGNLVADALRVRYGTDIGFVNGGGLRAPLPSDYAPQDLSLRRLGAEYAAGPPFDLVIGDVYSVLPFGNVTVTRTVTGEQLWAMVEHGVSALPAPVGFFGQVSGIRVVFDSSQPAGSRVVELSLDDTTPVAPDDTAYTLATSDFLAAGGDGYAMLADGDGVPRDKLAEVVMTHIQQLGTIDPSVEGRLVDVASP